MGVGRPLAEQGGPEGAVGAEPGGPLGQGQSGHLLVGPVGAEGVDRGVEAEHDADGAAPDLPRHGLAGGVGGMDLVAGGAPALGVVVDLEEQHRQWAAGQLGRLAEVVEVAGGEVGVGLEHTGAGGPHGGSDGGELGIAGREAGGGPTVGRPVLHRAAGGEAEGAGPQPLLDQGAELGQFGLRRDLGVVGTPLAHHVEAESPVGDLGADVHHPGGRSEGVEVLGEALPGEVDPLGQHRAGDVLDPLHEVDEEVLGAGADGGEAHPTVAEHGRGHPMPRRGGQLGIPGGLAVVVGVDIDPAGQDELTLGLDRAPGLTIDGAGGADGRDRVAADGHVGLGAGGPAPVHHGAVGDEEVVHDRTVPVVEVGLELGPIRTSGW